MEKSLNFDPNCKDCRHRIGDGKNGVSQPTYLVLQIPANDYYSYNFRVPQYVTPSVEIKHVDIDCINSTIVGTIDPDSEDLNNYLVYDQNSTACFQTSSIAAI